jgi:hypothetical protein
LQIHDVADFASEEGFAAGRAAARFIRQELPQIKKIQVWPGNNIRYVLPQHLNPDAKSVALNFRVRAPQRQVRIVVQGKTTNKIYFQKKYPRLVPSELEKITLREVITEDMELTCHA